MRFILIIGILISSRILSAQTPTNALYGFVNEAHSGLHLGVDWRYMWGEKWVWYGGIHYLDNRFITDNQMYAYKHRFYAANLGEHFGIRLGTERQFILNEVHLKPFVFMQFQQTRASLMYESGFGGNNLRPPVISVEMSSGGGLYIPVYRQLDFRLAAGVSHAIIFEQTYGTTWDGFSSLVEGGLVWRLNRAKAQ
ncbi:MAG: hypothetical protein MUC87_09875 [Bacteroidia bacterium]|jgi:hypothetical protein|nr:hypothetical protein [Bacteroidia bacterium]